MRKKLKIILIVGLVIIIILSVILVLLIIDKNNKKAELQKQILIQKEQEALDQEIAKTEANLVIETEETKHEDEDIMMEESEFLESEKEVKPVEKEKADFSINEIIEGDEVYNRIIGKSYVDNPNVALSDLRYLIIPYYNFDHQVKQGEMIVNKSIADDVINIFKELYDNEYEIYSMKLIDEFWTGDGDTSDTASCDANNTSAFCYREVTGGGSLSNHAYGCAIDVNPQQNPYVSYKTGEPKWSHENANDYIDRTSGDPHVIVEGDFCYQTFAKHGFKWGGAWTTIKDYQHFEKR